MREKVAEALERIREEALRLASMASGVRDAVSPEDMVLRTNVAVVLTGPDGRLKDRRDIHNIICTAGKRRLLLATGAQTVDEYDRVCIGTGTATPSAGDTALQAEVARVQGTTTNPNADTWQVVSVFGAGVGTGAITESALDRQASPSGQILCRQTFSVINKGAGDTLTVTWQIT